MSEIDPENNNECNFSSNQEENPSKNTPPGRENTRFERYPNHRGHPQTYLPSTMLAGNTTSNSGSVSSDSTSVYIESEHFDVSEIDPENNDERNVSCHQEEYLSKNKPPGRGASRHVPYPTPREQPKTYLPTAMLTGRTRSTSGDVSSDSTSVYTDSEHIEDLASMEYSECDSVPEGRMPKDQNVCLDKLPVEDHPPHSSRKRNLMYWSYIGAIVVVIGIIVTVVVVATKKKGGSSSPNPMPTINVPDVVSPTFAPTSTPVVYPPAIASPPPVTSTVSPTVASSSPVTSPVRRRWCLRLLR